MKTKNMKRNSMIASRLLDEARKWAGEAYHLWYVYQQWNDELRRLERDGEVPEFYTVSGGLVTESLVADTKINAQRLEDEAFACAKAADDRMQGRFMAYERVQALVMNGYWPSYRTGL